MIIVQMIVRNNVITCRIYTATPWKAVFVLLYHAEIFCISYTINIVHLHTMDCQWIV